VFLKNLAWAVSVLLLLATTSSSAGAAQSNGRKVYKWVDEQGVTHFGDHIPPEYSSQEQHVVNSQGVETEHIEAQRTPEQLAAEEKKRFEAEQKASRDKNLLNTYAAVPEIERLRDQRLALLADQIKVTGQFLEILNGRMKKLRVASQRFRPYSNDPKAPPMSDEFAEDLVRVDNDIHTQQENLREKRNEEATMSKQFESDIARFKELKGIH
jgi:Domain of unknown function (DUF4124)